MHVVTQKAVIDGVIQEYSNLLTTNMSRSELECDGADFNDTSKLKLRITQCMRRLTMASTLSCM